MVLTGLLYAIWGLWTGHFRSNLFPAPADRTWQAFGRVIAKHIRLKRPDEAEAFSYNVVQRAAYLVVIFILFPLVIWTGLALSPGFNAAFPAAVNVLGGRQSARTLHFFISAFLLLFLIVHVAMVVLGGFTNRMRAMITGKWSPGRCLQQCHRAPATRRRGAHMSTISRRKFVTAGLAATAGVSGVAVAASSGEALWAGPAR